VDRVDGVARLERIAGEHLARRPAQPAAADVDEDGDQPAAGGCGLAQLADPSQRDQQRVLDGVVGLGAVAKDADGDGVQPRAMALEQEAQSDRVAGLGGANELGVVGRPHGAIVPPEPNFRSA
jgi:hypothetical protein